MPREVIVAAIRSLKDWTRIDSEAELTAHDLTLSRLGSPVVRLPYMPLDGRYPKWREVFERSGNYATAVLSPDLLSGLLAVFKAVDEHKGVAVSISQGGESPAVLHMDACGVLVAAALMPISSSDEDAVPAWVCPPPEKPKGREPSRKKAAKKRSK